MPKDINPMPPRTFRGGFLFVHSLNYKIPCSGSVEI